MKKQIFSSLYLILLSFACFSNAMESSLDTPELNQNEIAPNSSADETAIIESFAIPSCQIPSAPTEQFEPMHFKDLKEFENKIKSSNIPICVVLTNPLDDQTATLVYEMNQLFADSIEFIRLDSHRDAEITKTITHSFPAFFFMYQGRYAIDPICGRISKSEFHTYLEQLKAATSKQQTESEIALSKFQTKMIENQRTALLIFTASPGWCSPCQFMEPFLLELKEKHKGTIKFNTYYYDKHHELRAKFDISTLPTFIFMQEGKEIYRFSGATNKEAFEQILTIFDSKTTPNKVDLDAIVEKGKFDIEEDFFIVDYNEPEAKSLSQESSIQTTPSVECSEAGCIIK